MARDEEFNRRVLESLKFDYLVSPEINSGKDGLKQRSSGINHVLAKIAKERGVSFLVPLNDFEGLNRREKSIRIARIIQNVRLCRKAKCPIKLASFSDKRAYSMRERGIIGTSWGMSSQQAADSCVF
jgi:RNase P/RNase MRP subunit p30